MRDWLGKPMMILAVILLVLGVITAYFLLTAPSPALGDDRLPAAAHHREVNRLIQQIENGQ